MKRTFITSLLAMSLLAGVARADTLILSQDLMLDYPSPTLISHTSNMLIVKYEDWAFSHEIVNPKTFYPGIDLSGVVGDYIRSIFEPSKRESLPGWLAALADEQAQALGLPGNRIFHGRVGEFELVGLHSKSQGTGNLYLYDRASIHHLVVLGTEDDFNKIIQAIKER